MTAHQRNVNVSIDPVKLDRLAEVAVKVGLRLQPGQDLLLTAPSVALPLVRRIAEHAYKAGAGIVTPFFSAEPVGDFAAATACDLGAYGAFCRALLDRGIYPPASQFEAWFVSLAHDEAAIDRTCEAAAEAFAAAATASP